MGFSDLLLGLRVIVFLAGAFLDSMVSSIARLVKIP